ncbi:MAG: murein biosynthesis integral membrane protein MurJ [Candidatus Sericytochromatia bacterium]|nr:murein biosynthesis integral membrane protein MurJ [Candidatus Sericytochromatia bacterium]
MSKGLLGVASAIALVTLLSKAVGFGRELVIAAVHGAGVAKDAYTAAYIIPSFALILLGGLTGPFHTATQRVVTSLREQGRGAEVPGVVVALAAWVTLVMGGGAVLACLAAPALISAVASRAPEPVFDLAVAQLRIMAPLIVMGGWVGILCGVSNDLGDFKRPSLSPLVASVAVIGTVLWSSDPLMLAWGTLLGGIGQVLLQADAAVRLWRSRSPGTPPCPMRHPELRGIWQMLLPACVSSTVGTLAVVIGTNFASALPAGSISVFDYANKLVQLPLGVLMTALLIPLFPMLTRAVVSGDGEALRARLAQGVSAISLVSMPLVALFLSAGTPIVSLVYQRGAFTAADAEATARVLGLCALGIPAYAVRDLVVRVFYALNDGRTPLLVSVASLAVTAAGMAMVVSRWGLDGLALVTSGVTVLNCAATTWLLRRRLGAWPFGDGTGDAVRAAVAALVAGGAAHVTRLGLVGGSLPGGEAVLLVAQALVLAVAYTGSLAVLGLSPTRIRERLATRRGAAA